MVELRIVIVSSILESTPQGMYEMDQYRRAEETWRREHPDAAALDDEIQEQLEAVVLYGVMP